MITSAANSDRAFDRTLGPAPTVSIDRGRLPQRSQGYKPLPKPESADTTAENQKVTLGVVEFRDARQPRPSLESKTSEQSQTGVVVCENEREHGLYSQLWCALNLPFEEPSCKARRCASGAT
jgi:hypothetical protein